MDERLKLHEKEYEFACIVWENEPLTSKRLSEICEEKLNWKRTTTYTVLKKLINKGIMKNENKIVTAIVKKEEIQRYESQRIIERVFDNSLPMFINAFMSQKRLSDDKIEELKRYIDEYQEKKEGD